jgi:dTDP-4-dehydrorhamnose reductase
MGYKANFYFNRICFDGQDGNYSEESRTNPIVLYGKQKKQIEDFIRSNFSEYLIFRLAKVFGITKNDNTIFTNWMESLNKHDTILCAEDQRFSPVYVGDVIDVIYQFSKSGRKGIYNLGGEKAFTRLELLKILIKERSKFITSRIDIQTCKFNSFDLGEEWPVDVSLNVEKIIKSTNIKFMSPIKACQLILKSYQIQEK